MPHDTSTLRSAIIKEFLDGEIRSSAIYFPNPEYEAMINTTTRVCEMANIDIGIMLDTDVDGCSFSIARSNEDALMSLHSLSRFCTHHKLFSSSASKYSSATSCFVHLVHSPFPDVARFSVSPLPEFIV